MTFRHEKIKIAEGYQHVIGCDEVGRGCLAGPVVAAAVSLRKEFLNPKSYILNLKDVKDSKLLTASKRTELAQTIKKYFLWSIAEVSSEEVDKINIHNASLLAMKKAVNGLSGAIEFASAFVCIDGKFPIPNFNIEQEAVVGGDNKVLSIAAASIIAKVYRDSLMQKFDKQYPNYNLAKHKGYATEHHRAMVLKHGLSPIHRLSFCSDLKSSK